VSELKCPLCNCRFSAVDDLAKHLTTHKKEADGPSTQGEVVITEVGVEGLKEVTATVVSVVKDCKCELCRKAAEKARFKPRYPRWHIVLRPDREDYHDFNVWISADSAYAKDPRTAGKGTQLGDFVQRLKDLGLKGGTVDELFAEMLKKEFLWERARIGRRQRDTWIPKMLLAADRFEGEGAVDPVQACAEKILSRLERGKAYTVRETEAIGIDFPSDVVEEAWELLVQMGKAFKLPTKPAKYFYEG